MSEKYIIKNDKQYLIVQKFKDITFDNDDMLKNISSKIQDFINKYGEDSHVVFVKTHWYDCIMRVYYFAPETERERYKRVRHIKPPFENNNQ